MSRHPEPDPSSRRLGLEPCFSCGAPAPAGPGPTHPYMLSSPGCFALFGEVLRREFSDLAYMKNHRLTVDAYAVQHPGEPNPQATRSVRAHLCMLHVVLERQWPHERAVRFLQGFANRNKERRLEWLAPPASPGELTVADAHRTTDLEEHLATVERWARSAWQAWSEHHDRVRSWLGAG